MSVAGLPEHNELLARCSEMVTAFMRDHAELNRLTADQETSPRMVQFCIVMALNEANITPPCTNWTLAQFPPFLMLYGSIITILESLVLLKARNTLNFNDGGMTISRENPQLVAQLIQLFRSTYERKLNDYKIFMNISSALTGGGGVASELWAVNRLYGTWW